MDGAGNPWIQADLGIRAGRIAAIGRLAGATAQTTIDAAGLLVTPGFIDVHSHAGEGLARQELKQGQPLLAQGVTTIVANPDGGGPVDLAAQRATLEKGGVGVNVGLLIGHGSVRGAVMGSANRAPTAPELDAMRALVRRGMQQGAFGLSSGLFYTPGSFAGIGEAIALAAAAGESGGLYTSHIRDEGDYGIGVVASVQEVIRIADEAHVIGIVTHMKALGPDNWGLSAAMTARIDAARARGVQVLPISTPHCLSTSLRAALLPGGSRCRRWTMPGGRRSRRRRRRISGAGAGPSRFRSRSTVPTLRLRGTLDQIAEARGVTRARRARAAAEGQRVDRLLQHVRGRRRGTSCWQP